MEMKATNSLQQLLDDGIYKLIAGETILKNTLPKWIDETHSLSLKTMLRNYSYQISVNVEKLKAMCASHEENRKQCVTDRIMQAYIEDTNEKLERSTESVQDASLLEAIQAISQYKIHAYNSVAAWAITLEMLKDAKFLNDAKLTEKNIDERLYYLAIREVNRKARAPMAITA